MMKLSLACGLALSATLAACSSVPKAAPTATAAPASSTSPTTAVASSKTPKLICEDTAQIGSHMPAHICLTPEQVAQRQKDSQQAAFDLQNRAQPLNSSASASGKPPA